MARTRLTARRGHNSRKLPFRLSQTPGAKNRSHPGIGKKNIRNGQISNYSVKMKRLKKAENFKKVRVKQRRRVVSNMTLRRKTHYPIRFHWQLKTTSSRFWLVNILILLLKFDTLWTHPTDQWFNMLQTLERKYIGVILSDDHNHPPRRLWVEY